MHFQLSFSLALRREWGTTRGKYKNSPRWESDPRFLELYEPMLYQLNYGDRTAQVMGGTDGKLWQRKYEACIECCVIY